jgi:hypothetical protein
VPPIEREGDLEEDEISEELMHCPELSNAYIKSYTVLGRRYKRQLKKKATLQIQ